MHQTVQDSRQLLEQLLPQRYVTGRIIDFLHEEGVFALLVPGDGNTLEEILDLLKHRLGFEMNDRTRLRMIRIIIDLLCECGFMNKKGDRYVCDGMLNGITGLSAGDIETLEANFSGQINFFEGCIDYAGKFLRGAPPLYGFDDNSLHVWEDFLGNMEFEFARSLLLKSLLAKKFEGIHLLDLCCGPGFDIVQIQDMMPEAVITALDFKDIFYREAYQRARNPSAIEWMNSDLWKGFGAPLPFNDNSFNVVFFACADPYIPEDLREFVYRDIFRILKSGGTLGILTNCYPDPAGNSVKNIWIRRGVLSHDFAESVCEGWSGFCDPDESRRLFRKVGFDISLVMLNDSVWRLDKP